MLFKFPSSPYGRIFFLGDKNRLIEETNAITEDFVLTFS